MNFHKIVFFVALALLCGGACQQQRAGLKSASPDAKRYELTGKVVSVDKPARKAKIEHDKIEGYMEAMTMNFPIKEDWVIRELEPGDKIAAEMVVETNGDYSLEVVKIMKLPRDAATNETLPRVEAGKDKIGLEVPNFALVNQDGKKIQTNDFRGKILLVTFVFTRCPDVEMCPALSIKFSDLEKQIRQNAALAANVRLLSVTFDPQFDTPDVLKKYGAGYQGKDTKTNFDIWQLATGDAAEIKRMTDFFGVTAQPAEHGNIIHNARTAVISQDGKIYKIYGGGNWNIADVQKDLQAFQAQ